MTDRHYIASVSWGKDSLAMLYILIGDGYKLDEVMFFDTGMEFDAIYDVRDQTLPLLEEHGIAYTELKPKDPMWWSMFCRPVQEKKPQENPNPMNAAFAQAGMLPEGIHYGYGWCGGPCRWGTSKKNNAMDKYAKARNALVYVGIAADETSRLEKEKEPWKLHPLADLGMTEADCLALCKGLGYTWEQDGVPLYDVLDRVSCWCCRNKNQKELRAIHDHLPSIWDRLVAMESILGTMKGAPLESLIVSPVHKLFDR